MAQVGRISGPLLFSNLERNGKDIDFRNQQASVPTLKLDVNNNYIGINKTAPAFALDIGGSATLNFSDIKLTSLTPGNFSISNDDITVFSGDINFTNPVVQSENRTQQLRITGNKIDSYVTNAPVTLDANGTGTIEFLTDTNVDGALHATGDISLEGNVIIGDSTAVDTVSFNADVDSSIIPDLHNTHDFGENNSRFSNLYADTLYNSQVTTNSLIVDNIDVTKIVGNVFWVSPNGDNNNKGDHPQAPWRTLTYALQAADSSVAGPVVIHMESGEYQETFPLTVPEQVSVYGEDMRNVIITPTTGTESENAFLLNDSSTIQNITVKDFYYDSANDKGYAFAFAPNASISSRSPYVFNTTVLTQGQVTSADDPRGYNSLDAGRGVKCDGAVVDSNSPQASMLFYSLTLITPGVTAVKATNGVRIEWLNSFIYFAKEGIRVENGSTGRLTSDGSTINYGGEMRCINSANIYGEKGIIADGSDALVYIVEHTFSYAGTGKRADNDTSFVTEKFETTELNNGKVLGTFVDKDGGFNVGDVLYVNQDTGDVEFKSVDFDFSDIAALTINTDGSVVTIDGEKVQTDLIRFRNNIVESTAGPLNFAAAPQMVININDNVTINANLDVSGNLTIGGALVRLGDADTDSIDFNAEVDNNFIPNLNNTYTLGTTSKYWHWLYSSILDTGDIVLETNKIRTTESNSDLELGASGTGSVVIPRLRAGQTATITGTSTFNTTIDMQSTMAVTGNIDVNGNATFANTTTDNLNANSNVTIGDVHFVGNRITTLDTNSNLELRPSGTGLFKIVGDLVIENRLVAPGADYTLVDATMEETSAGHLVVQSDLTIQGMSINESFNISGNVIESNVTNADAELRATGTGNVVFQENLQVDNNVSVGGNMVLDVVTLNNLTAGDITTNTADVPSFDFDNIEFTGNFITTTLTNSDLELRANGTGVVRVDNDTNLEDNLTVKGTSTIKNATARTFTAQNLTVNENITMPSNMTLEGVDFIGNTITSNRTNSDLDLRASGTGVVRIPTNDVVITNDLTVNGNTTFGSISSTNARPNTLIVNRLDAFGTQFEDVNITGNKITTTLTNSNLELGAGGTGVVRFTEAVSVPNLTVNNTLTVEGITVNADVEFDEIETSGDILFNDNYITTTESNSDLELRGNADGRIRLDDVEFKGDTLYADRADSTISTLELRANKFVIDSTDSLTLPKGTISANEDSTSTADIRYDTSINQFVGKRGGFQAVFGGIYSNDLQTRVRIDSNNNAIFFDVNGTNVMEMNSIGETYVHRIELSGSDSTPGGIDIDDNVISTNWTNADLTLLPEGGTGRTNIEDLQFLDKTIYTTGTNIGTLAATGKGYIKFDQDNGLRIPIGTSAEREPNPEVGSSRFNTDLAYLENYTAGGWVTAAGTGAGVSEDDMNEIMNEFILIFG